MAGVEAETEALFCRYSEGLLYSLFSGSRFSGFGSWDFEASVRLCVDGAGAAEFLEFVCGLLPL